MQHNTVAPSSRFKIEGIETVAALFAGPGRPNARLTRTVQIVSWSLIGFVYFVGD